MHDEHHLAPGRSNLEPVPYHTRTHLSLDKNAIVQREAPQQGDVPLTWVGISKAGKLLGYRPQTSLEEGLKKSVA
jgi:nucleoside-diphosphate-sugar epimerase